MASDTKIFKVDKFLGLNEAADSTTEMKLGEASVAENFYITDDYNIRRRPGVVKRCPVDWGCRFLGVHTGYRGKDTQWLLTVEVKPTSLMYIIRLSSYSGNNADAEPDIEEALQGYDKLSPDHPVKIFDYASETYILGSDLSGNEMIGFIMRRNDGRGRLSVEEMIPSDLYVPVIFTGASPAGDGTEMESVNLLTNKVRLQYSADGTATAFVLPDNIVDATATVDNEAATGTFSADTHKFTFSKTPSKGVNNVEFTCSISDDELKASRVKFLQMKHCESFNGGADSRLFFYGDGTNICYYSGVPGFGSGLYIPALSEIAIDSSASPITGMVRHYTQLLAFKPDGVFSISYAPTTLADGRIIAGFNVKTANRNYGNEMDAQIQTVGNYPRSLSNGNLYEWRGANSNYQDERYAKRVSEKVCKTLSSIPPQQIITCDDNATQTYYMFLNDEDGTVLVNRYAVDAWFVYKGNMFKDVQFAAIFDGQPYFVNPYGICRFDWNANMDVAIEYGEYDEICAVWETGYMDFGSGFRKKHSSYIWMYMLPEPASDISVTVTTDCRDEYLEKNMGCPTLDFSKLDFSNFSFLFSLAPQSHRAKIKVKKFVYYKLILRTTKPGAAATVLGYDQQVRFASNVK